MLLCIGLLAKSKRYFFHSTAQDCTQELSTWIDAEEGKTASEAVKSCRVGGGGMLSRIFSGTPGTSDPPLRAVGLLECRPKLC